MQRVSDGELKEIYGFYMGALPKCTKVKAAMNEAIVADLIDLRAAAREFFQAEDDYAKVGPEDPLGDWDTGDVEAQCAASEVIAQKKDKLRALVEGSDGRAARR